MDPRIWSALLCLLMVIFVLLELLTPTAGGFTLAGLAAAGGSVYMAFVVSEPFGYFMIALNLVLFPVSLYLGVKLLSTSPLMLSQELTHGAQSSSDAPPLTQLLGQEGTALTPLRPAGAAMFGAARVDVVAEGRFIERDTRVKVIHIEGNRVVVEPAETAPAPKS